jgi:hypothetical protein
MKLEKKSLLFFEKKRSKKNFDSRICGTAGAPAGSKSFLVLFFKKELLLL